MRLLSCHIENFGIYSNETIDFKEGLNASCKENGGGKSTLVAFLYTMFFGFPTGGKSKLPDGVETRDFYKPWQGGVFGGKITFEAGGKTYTLQKTFGAKEAEDTTSFIETSTGLESTDFEGGKGKSIFQLDGDSFLRTVLATQNHVARDQYVSDGISARIGNVDSLANDVMNAEQADNAIKERLNYLSPKNKGLIKKTQGEIIEIEQRVKEKGKVLQNIETLEKEIANFGKQIESLTKEGDELGQELQRQGKIRDLYKEKKAYEKLLDSLKDREKGYEDVRKTFGEEIPDLAFLDDSITKLTALSVRKENLREKELKEEEKIRLEDLSRKYGSLFSASEGISEEEKGKLTKSLSEYTELKTEYERNKRTEEDVKKLEESKKRFEEPGITKDKIYDNQSKWNRMKEERQSLSVLEAELARKKEAYEAVEKEKPTGQLVMAFVSLLVLIAGIILVVLKMVNSGIILGVVGLLGFAISMALFGKRKKDIGENKRKCKAEEQAVLAQYEEKQENIENMRTSVQSFLSSCGYNHGEERYETDFYDLSDAFREYEKRKADFDGAPDIAEQKEKLELVKQRIQAFFEKYDQDGNPSEDYWTRKDRIYQETDLFCRLSEKNSIYQKEKDSVLTEEKELSEALNQFNLILHETEVSDLQKMSVNRKDLDQASAELDRAKKELEAYEQAHETIEAIKDFDLSSVTDRDISEDGMTKLTEKLDAVNKEKNTVKDLVRDRENRVELEKQKKSDIEDDENKLSSLKEIVEDAEEETSVLEIARDYLKKAKENFQNQYRKPVNDAFEKYYKLLVEGTDSAFPASSNLMLDANFQFKIEEKGQGRQPKSFSAGIKDYYGVCMRLAMVDAMYEGGEKPFIVLDDPFVNYDNGKLPGAMHLLKELSKEYQVLYFTCREETMPK